MGPICHLRQRGPGGSVALAAAWHWRQRGTGASLA